jgi:hypothetical protein
MVERNTGSTAMRGTVRPAGVQEHITRKRIAPEAGRSRIWPLGRVGPPVRIGKARSRSR